MLESLRQCLMLMNLPERALEVSEAILTLEPQIPGLFSVGQFHFQSKDFDRAVTYRKRARVEDPCRDGR